MVIGKLRMQAFDLDSLQEIIKKVPSGAGEARFWLAVDSTNTAVPTKEPNHECVVIQAIRRQIQEVQA